MNMNKSTPWHKQYYADMPDGWAWLTGDADWEGCGASWYKFLPDGSALVIRLENMIDCMGERDCQRDNVPEFLVELLLVDLPNIPKPELDSALSSSGWRFVHYQGEGLNRRFVIEDSHDHELVVPSPIAGLSAKQLADNDEYQRVQRNVLLGCLVGYGMYGRIGSWEAHHRPLILLKRAREQAKLYIADSRPYVNKPVNAIGTTVQQAARGNLLGGLEDYARDVVLTGEAPDPKQNLSLKLYGVDVEEIKSARKGGVMYTMKQSDIKKCPHMVMLPEHYRSDGSCKCDDPEHRKVMKKWGYGPKDFKDIPVRKE